MSIQLLTRRQQWPTLANGVGSPIGDYAIHVRFLGVNPTVPNDLIVSMLFCLVFAGLVGVGIFLGRNPAYRNMPMYTLFATSILFFLAFAIRAGISNSSNPSRSSFIVECLFLVFGQLAILDTWTTRTTDEIVDWLEHKGKLDLRGEADWKSQLRKMCHDPASRWALLTRIIIIPLCVILYIVGYATVPDPVYGAQSGSNNATRAIASFLVIIALCTMEAIHLNHACFESPPWIPCAILFAIGIMLWVPALYALCLLATAPDTSSLVRSKTFFYVGFGGVHAIVIAGLILMNRQKRVWEYQAGQEPPPEEGKEEAEAA